MAKQDTAGFSIFRSLEDIDHSVPKGYQRRLKGRRDMLLRHGETADRLAGVEGELNPLDAAAHLACGESAAALAGSR